MSAVVIRGGVTTPVTATVRRTGRTSLAVNVAAADLGLRPGAMRLHALDDRRRPLKESTPGRLRWRPVTAVGCTRRGPGQVFRGPRSRPWVAVSFDDGPGAATPAILNLLARYHAHATFFAVGQNATYAPALVRCVLAEGHGLANHSWRHSPLPGGSDLRQTNNALRSITGYTPCPMRPPYGLTNRTPVSNVTSLGMMSVTWSVDTSDRRRPRADVIARRALRALRARAGDIVLMHDGDGPRARTVSAVATILRALRARGLEPVSIEQLLGFPTTYVVR